MCRCLTSWHACQGAPRNLWHREKISKTYLLTIIFLLSSCIAVAQAQTSTGTKMGFSAHAVVNFAELARKEKLHPVAMQQQQAVAVPEMRHVNLPVPADAPTIHLKNRGQAAEETLSPSESSASASPQSLSAAPFSPAARFGFSGVSDNGLRIPPVPSGAVNQSYPLEPGNRTS